MKVKQLFETVEQQIEALEKKRKALIDKEDHWTDVGGHSDADFGWIHNEIRNIGAQIKKLKDRK